MESIILIGHGSPKKDANNIEVVGRMLHSVMHPKCKADCVRVAYMQFSDPDIMGTINGCIAAGATKIILHPFFLSSGMHVTKDIPEIIETARKANPDVEFIYTEPLGIHEKLVHVVIDRIKNANGFVPADIETRSFEIISEETDLSEAPPEQLPIIKRVIHSTADFEFRETLMFHPDAIAEGLQAIKAGKDILTDIEMVRSGINKKRLEKWGGKVICNIQQSAFSDQQSAEGTVPDLRTSPSVIPGEVVESGLSPSTKGRETRSERGIEQALKENNNIGIIAIGNAPTALLKVIELLNTHNSSLMTHNCPLVVGVPVGFVKAFESKALLSTQKFPFITNLSRKGGTPVAVAIINALLKMAEETQ